MILSNSLFKEGHSKSKRIEYILKGNLLEKKCKTAILLYCFHTAGVLHIFMLQGVPHHIRPRTGLNYDFRD